MADDVVRNLLQSWDLAELVDHFNGNYQHQFYYYLRCTAIMYVTIVDSRSATLMRD